jgi:hypothetical protein
LRSASIDRTAFHCKVLVLSDHPIRKIRIVIPIAMAVIMTFLMSGMRPGCKLPDPPMQVNLSALVDVDCLKTETAPTVLMDRPAVMTGY